MALADNDLVCWAKNRRLVLNAVKPNVYRETYLLIGFTDRSDPSLSRSGWRDHVRLLGWAPLCANLQQPRDRP